MPDVSPVFPDQQAAVSEALAAIGVTPDYQPVNGETFISDLLSAKYPAAIFGLNTQRPWDFAQLALTPEALWNTFHVADPTVVSLVDEAQGQTADEQTATFRELNEYIVDQAWFAPYIQSNNVFAVSSDISIAPQKFSTVPPIWNFTPAE
jgi:peptide/nickel transport system substrate-binding protein